MWPRNQSIQTTTEHLRDKLKGLARSVAVGSIMPALPVGNTPTLITKREAAMRHSIPGELRVLYEHVDGEFVMEDHDWGYKGTDSIELHTNCKLLPLVTAGWHKCREFSWVGELPDALRAWREAKFFRFATSADIDEIGICPDLPTGQRDAVILIEFEPLNAIQHELWPGNYFPIIVLGDSLADWLERWMACEFWEPACAPCGLDTLPLDVQRAYLLDHLRLNPGVEWARERLASIDG